VGGVLGQDFYKLEEEVHKLSQKEENPLFSRYLGENWSGVASSPGAKRSKTYLRDKSNTTSPGE